VRVVSVPTLAVIAAESAAVIMVVAVPAAPVTTEAADSVPTSVANWTITPDSGAPLTFWTLAVTVARPASTPVPTVAPNVRLKGVLVEMGGTVDDGASGL
jgi:hypothetical protein